MNFAFNTATKIFELFSAVMLWVFSVAVLASGGVFSAPSYTGFLDRWTLLFVVVALASCATYCITRHTAPTRFCAGFNMVLSALVWAIVGSQFFKSWPPTINDYLVYVCAVMTLFCFLVGFKNITDSRAAANVRPVDD